MRVFLFLLFSLSSTLLWAAEAGEESTEEQTEKPVYVPKPIPEIPLPHTSEVVAQLNHAYEHIFLKPDVKQGLLVTIPNQHKVTYGNILFITPQGNSAFDPLSMNVNEKLAELGWHVHNLYIRKPFKKTSAPKITPIVTDKEQEGEEQVEDANNEGSSQNSDPTQTNNDENNDSEPSNNNVSDTEQENPLESIEPEELLNLAINHINANSNDELFLLMKGNSLQWLSPTVFDDPETLDGLVFLWPQIDESEEDIQNIVIEKQLPTLAFIDSINSIALQNWIRIWQKQPAKQNQVVIFESQQNYQLDEFVAIRIHGWLKKLTLSNPQ